jgi:hypothetical protein
MFDKVVKVQNRYLAREINFFEGGRKLLSASVDSITHLSPSDAALTPSDDASVFEVKRINVSAGVAAGLIVKKQVPAYPQDAKEARIAGRVVLQATIGTDAESYRAKEIAARFDELHVALLSKTADTTPAEILVAVLEHTNLDDDPRWIAPEAGLSL